MSAKIRLFEDQLIRTIEDRNHCYSVPGREQNRMIIPGGGMPDT